MTWTHTAFRKELRDHIRDGGLDASSYWPDRFTPPLVIVDGGEPYLDLIEEPSFVQVAQQFNAEATVHLELTIIAGVGDTEDSRDDLDDLIMEVQRLLYTFESDLMKAGLTVQATQQPFQIGPVQNANFLASRLTVTTEITLEEV